MSNASVILFSDSSMNIGGQELQAIQQMCTLNTKGYRTLLLCKPESAISQYAKRLNLEFVEVPFRNAFHLPSFSQLLRIVKKNRPIAMVCHGSHDALICALAGMMQFLLHGKRTPVFRVKTFQHGYPLSFAYKYLFSKTITPSLYLRSLFLKNAAIKSSNISVLYPGIDFAGLDRQPQELPATIRVWLESHPGPVISHGAILRGEKGHSTTLKALVEVKKLFPRVRYLIAGEGQGRPLLEAEIISLGLSDNVLLTGILKDIAPLLRNSDLAVLPSLVEPLGMFQIEAQYFEVPTIVSRVGGIPETVFHQKTGLMLEAGNVREWADAIIWVLSNPIPAKKMAQEGKKFVEKQFSLEANTSGLLDLINGR